MRLWPASCSEQKPKMASDNYEMAVAMIIRTGSFSRGGHGNAVRNKFGDGGLQIEFAFLMADSFALDNPFLVYA